MPYPIRRLTEFLNPTGYWLRHCEGYRIRTPLGHEGFVEDVALDERHDRPERLSVRCRRRLIRVEAEEIDLVLPGSETIVLRRALPRVAVREALERRPRTAS